MHAQQVMTAFTAEEDPEGFARDFATSLEYDTPDPHDCMPQYDIILHFLAELAGSDAALQSVWIGLGLAPDRMEAEYPRMVAEDAGAA